MIKIKNLTKIYKTKTVETRALNNVSVDFGEKGMVFILGKSGSGKSTLLNLLGGLDKPTSGEIIINGRSSAKFKESDFDAYRNTYVGFVFQEYNLIDNYTVGANIALALELQGKKADKQAVDDILRKMELTDSNGETLYARHVNELSGGQKQRVAIARALIKEPKIILADEPTGALDSQTGKQLNDTLKELSKERLVIVISHDRESAESYGDRIIELADGKVISDSNCKENSVKEVIQDDNKFIKSRLPFKRTLAMGASALKHKPFRLVLSILLSVIAISVFGFFFNASFLSEERVKFNSMYDNGYSMISVMGDSYRTYEHDNANLDKPFMELSEKQIQTIQEYNGGSSLLKMHNADNYINIISDYLNEEEDFILDRSYFNPYVKMALGPKRYLVEINSETGTQDANLKPDERFIDGQLCRVPKTNDELAITDVLADMFIRFGYIGEDGSEFEIKTPDDLIGKKLGALTICGVYSTEIDRNTLLQYDKYDTSWSNDESLVDFLSGIRDFSALSVGYVCENFTDTASVGAMIKLSGNIEKDLKLINDLSYEEGNAVYSVQLNTIYNNFMAISFVQETLLVPFMIAATVFAVFSILLMMNFLFVSIDFKKKELGILRALGARRLDVVNICLVESLIIGLTDFALSVVAVAIACAIINSMSYISMFSFGILGVLVTFLICLLVSVVSTVLPVIKLTKKKPVDIINNK